MKDELPREKLAIYGPQHLSDRELVTILLSTGNKKENVFQIANRILHDFDREELKLQKNFNYMKQHYSLGNVHTGRLMASMELGKRLFEKPITDKQIQSYRDIFEFLKNMKHLKKEHFKGIYLNTRNFIIRSETISIGSLDANIIHPREVFRPAIEYSAYSIIVAHNHPSGDPRPSNADIEITKKLAEIGKLLQIRLFDHVIIGENGFFSFSEQGLLP